MAILQIDNTKKWLFSAKTKIQGILSIILIMVFLTILSIRQIVEEKQKIAETAKELEYQLYDLELFLEKLYDERMINIKMQLHFLSNYLSENKNDSSEQELIYAKNVITGQNDSYFVIQNFCNIQEINQNKIFEYYEENENYVVDIYKKIDDGFIQIFSSDLEKNSDFKFYPSNSNFVHSIATLNKNYTDVYFAQNMLWVKSSVKLEIDNEIAGILSITTKVLNSKYFEHLYTSKLENNLNYPFVVDYNGNMLIHPEIIGTRLAGSKLFDKLKTILSNEVRRIEYKWPENKYGTKKWLVGKRNEKIGVYICQVAQTKMIDELQSQSLIQKIVLISIAVSILLISIHFLLRSVFRRVNEIENAMNELSKGKQIQPLKVKNNDEISHITESFNTLNNAFKRSAEFVQKLSQGNYTDTYTLLSEGDKNGKALNELKNHLKKTQYDSLERRKANKLQNEMSDSLSKINDIIRAHTGKIEDLSYKIVMEVVEFTGCQLCGVFITENSATGEQQLKLSASYAYDRQRFINKTVSMGEGQVGICALEKQKIYITDLPDDYIKVTSGLGASNPKNLLIIPMLFDDTLQGVIELAALETFREYDIQFVEKIAEVLASSISFYKLSVNK